MYLLGLKRNIHVYHGCVKGYEGFHRSKIIDFVEHAHNNQTKAETFIRFEKIYVYVVISLSVLTMVILNSLTFGPFRIPSIVELSC